MPSIDRAGRRIHYLDVGVGDQPLVLLHAVPLQSLMWEPQIAAFEADFRVIAPDLAGHGESDPLDDPRETTIDGWADDVYQLVTELGVGPVVLVGASVGGDVALSFVRRYASEVDALVLACTDPTPAGLREAFDLAELEHWAAGGGDRDPVVRRLADAMVGEATHLRPEVMKKAMWCMEQNPTDGWIGSLAALHRRVDRTPDLAALDVPTFLVGGAEDRLVTPDRMEELAARVPGGRLSVVDDAGHLPSLENEAAFDAVVRTAAAA